MDVAFISEFVHGRRYFRYVDADDRGSVKVGASDPLEESYCQRVVDGRLPELMTDACSNDEALTLRATRALPVGAHLSVPIHLADGRVFGTLCCFSSRQDQSLTQRDLSMMRVFSDVVAEQIQVDMTAREKRRAIEHRIDEVLEVAGLVMVYQPIFHVADDRLVGFEALSRFHGDPGRTPDVWFAEATSVGKGVALESLAICSALAALSQIPTGLYLSVNASPELIASGALTHLLAGMPLDRIVVEVTEHAAIDQYGDLADVVRPLQARGLRIAIDDAGAGYACFRHILNLVPHIIKLDMSITRNIDTDRSRRALAAALCGFAAATDCKIVAEGVETASELATLRELGINKAQGYFLARPMSLEQALQLAP